MYADTFEWWDKFIDSSSTLELIDKLSYPVRIRWHPQCNVWSTRPDKDLGNFCQTLERNWQWDLFRKQNSFA